ncbi:UNVERIFIED_ORG: ABC-2 type transport system ATP-binding protein [Pseudomonas parafulva]|uniref:ABC transporter ATP-binding protein n=1 Tax=Pseudomonas TaxID=286 RepID=UPI00048E1C79|nr:MULTISPECIES: ABC transporter ATP-binding protein [Pseudomonas]MDP9555522.1 ABC-2 type transport system ATP-binding protein [Pseudomonas parafulva]HCP31178.1 ABC transporter ATP-binding protein [Pseudomonas sp.]AVF55294.1 ABC transporter ATP-binding protein [Pseudomonas fulva]MBA1220454.1 ATP-binding cassette domain-containing protein [Pseudomonas fulva]MBN4165281.1 ATP-binding cassette domain-containing protein [Pseudomonas fulva]
MNALHIEGVSFAYGQRAALRDVTFSLTPGHFTALLGPNGAGKSTLIALMTCLYDVQHGDIQVLGYSLRRQPRAALGQLAVVFQQSTLDLDLSVEQNLRYHAALHGMPRREAQRRVDAELARQGLGERRRDPVRELNVGHRRRVEIARALLHGPRLLLLDEASVGLDPPSRQALNQHVRSLCHSDRRLSVLWTTHLLDEVQATDDLVILHQGRVVANGPAEAMMQPHGGDLGRTFAYHTCNTAGAPA